MVEGQQLEMVGDVEDSVSRETPADLEAQARVALLDEHQEVPQQQQWWTLLRDPQLASFFATKVMVVFGSAMTDTILPMVVVRQYGLSTEHTGFFLSFLGITWILGQALLVPWACRRFSDESIVHVSVGTIACLFLLIGWCTSLWELCVLLVPVILGVSTFLCVNTAQLTKTAPAHRQGSVIGLDMAGITGSRSVAPAIGGFLFGHVGLWLVCSLSGAVVLVALVLLCHGPLRSHSSKTAGPVLLAESNSRTMV